jgi:hypothetical protein
MRVKDGKYSAEHQKVKQGIFQNNAHAEALQ